MIERKSMLLLLAAAVFGLVSVPSVIFNNAIKKYFSFVGQWNVATIKPSRTAVIPSMHARADKSPEAPQPELRFARFTIKIAGAKDVRIAGDFNRWNPEALVLSKKDAKTWEAIVPLPPGKYKYLCRIDGQDVLDPLNLDTDMESGRKVSVLTVK